MLHCLNAGSIYAKLCCAALRCAALRCAALCCAHQPAYGEAQGFCNRLHSFHATATRQLRQGEQHRRPHTGPCSRQQAASGRQQAADSRQQTADNRQ
jgi:hypothetical protein